MLNLSLKSWSQEDKHLALISFFMVLLMGIGFVLTPIDYILGFFFLLIEAIFVFFIARKYRDLSALIWSAFLIRVGIMLLQAFVVNLPSSFSDAVAFEEKGWAWSQQGLLGTFQFFDLSRSYIYSWFIAFMYALSDRSPMMLQAVNVILGVGVVFNFYRTCEVMWGRSCARVVSWFVCFFPPMILYSAVTLREIPLLYFLTWGFYFAARWFRDHRLNDFLWGCVFFCCAGFIHGALLLVVPFFVLAFVIRLLRGMLEGQGRSVVALAVFGFLIVNLGILLISMKVGGSKLFSLYSDNPMESVMERVQGSSPNSSGKALHSNVSIDGPADIFLLLPRFVAYFLFAPFPWMIKRIYDLERIAVGIFWFFLFSTTIYNLKSVLKRPVTLFLLVTLSVLTLAFALGSRDLDTAYRHKNKLIIFALLITAPYIERVCRKFTFRW